VLTLIGKGIPHNYVAKNSKGQSAKSGLLESVNFAGEGAVHLRGARDLRHEFSVAKLGKSARRGKYLKYLGV
jgi:hypothetical protein